MSRSFRDLFCGGPKQHWRWTPADKPNAAGKSVAKTTPKDVRGEIAEDEWLEHESGGAYSLIVTPNLPDRTALFGVIDIDPSPDHRGPQVARELFALLGSKGLPFVVTESKGQGAHAWVFFQQSETAQEVRRVLEHVCQALDLKRKFNCQTIDIRPTPAGAGIQVPYFGASRMMPLNDGYATRDEFVEYINDHCVVDLPDLRRTVQAQLGELKKAHAKDTRGLDFEDRAALGPPCYEQLTKPGVVGEGMRNHTLVHLMGRLPHMFPDDWEEVAIKQAYTFEPPMKRAEIDTVIASYKRGGIPGLLCDNPSISPFCNKELCKLRPFGVLANVQLEEQIGFTITKLIKYRQPAGDVDAQNSYVVHVYFDGHDGFMVGTERILLLAQEFRACYLHRYQKYVNVGSQKMFEEMMGKVFARKDDIYFEEEMPREFTNQGIFEHAFRNHVQKRVWRDPVPSHNLFNLGRCWWDAKEKSLYIPPNSLCEDIATQTAKKLNFRRDQLIPMIGGSNLIRPGSEVLSLRYRLAGSSNRVIRIEPRWVGDPDDPDGWFVPPEAPTEKPRF